MTTRPPTPQGISALLRKAGYVRAETHGKGPHRGEVSAAGYRVTGSSHQGAVAVRWCPASDARPVERWDELAVQRAEYLGSYAADIEAAGWAVERKTGWLIVTAGAG